MISSYRVSLVLVAFLIPCTILIPQSVSAAQVGAPAPQVQPTASPAAVPVTAMTVPYNGNSPVIVVTQPPNSSDQTKDNLAAISTLVTLYYSAALLIGIAVAFLGWRSIRDLREKATEVGFIAVRLKYRGNYCFPKQRHRNNLPAAESGSQGFLSPGPRTIRHAGQPSPLFTLPACRAPCKKSVVAGRRAKTCLSP